MIFDKYRHRLAESTSVSNRWPDPLPVTFSLVTGDSKSQGRLKMRSLQPECVFHCLLLANYFSLSSNLILTPGVICINFPPLVKTQTNLIFYPTLWHAALNNSVVNMRCDWSVSHLLSRIRQILMHSFLWALYSWEIKGKKWINEWRNITNADACTQVYCTVQV